MCFKTQLRSQSQRCFSHTHGAAYSPAAKVLDWDLEGFWFKPQCSQNAITIRLTTAVGPLSKALNPNSRKTKKAIL